MIFEVMAEQLDRAWYEEYRRGLEERFREDKIVIRAQSVEVL